MLPAKSTSRLAFKLSVFAALLVGCATGVKMADIPSSADPREEVSKLETDISLGVSKNADVLAAKDFEKSIKYLDKAKRSLEKGKDREDTLDYLRTGRGFIQRALETAAEREPKAEGVFSARQMALQAGAGRLPKLEGDLAALDRDIIGVAEKLDKTSAKKLADFQDRYVDLERRSVVLNQLGDVQAALNAAKKSRGEKKAPVTYKTAELSLKTAESVISTNARNPQGYQAAVEKAHMDAAQLTSVLGAIEQSGGNIPESVAIRLVTQYKRITGLSSALTAVKAKSQAEESAVKTKTEELTETQKKLQAHLALEKARAQFTSAEAEAYQQGENLVIRLKQVNFASGSADLPASSLHLLAKVSEIAKSLKPSQIVVEGHTDSTGKASTNEEISQKRASAVASYLKSNGFENVKIESEGYGFKKPIATNKSKEGRAQNRRVDIVITPEQTVE